jgi:hypothetical protein
VKQEQQADMDVESTSDADVEVEVASNNQAPKQELHAGERPPMVQ